MNFDNSWIEFGKLTDTYASGRLNESQPPYTFDVIGARNYFGDNDFYLRIWFGSLSDVPPSVTLSNFSFELDLNAN
jgi:hypothetical protein